ESYLAATEHRECHEGLIKSYDLDKTLFSTYGKVYSLKRSQKDKDKDEDPSAGSDRGLKKRKTSKDAKPTKGLKVKESQSGSSKDMPQDQDKSPGNDDEEPKGKTPLQGPTQSWLMTLASSADKLSKTFDELMSTHVDFSAYIMNDLKISNLTQETLPVKVAYDKHALWGISHWRDQLTWVEVMQKHGRADNDLYMFKEGDFPRLRINDFEDMLLLIVQNMLTNLSGDDVSDFAIALRMLMRSDELYKFSDGTLTRLRTSLDDITKNI
ncbi:hypothetical protein Tco_1249342, partial [Tanacetum coccineum]